MCSVVVSSDLAGNTIVLVALKVLKVFDFHCILLLSVDNFSATFVSPYLFLLSLQKHSVIFSNMAEIGILQEVTL